MVVPPVANLLACSGSGDALDINHVVDDQARPTEQAGSGKRLQHVLRPPRPSYTEEQKFSSCTTVSFESSPGPR
jgi:hypothetical protein